jgi:hypothetical protein
MASLAQQVVFHPAASQTLKLLATTVGRDKASLLPGFTPAPQPDLLVPDIPHGSVLCALPCMVALVPRTQD